MGRFYKTASANPMDYMHKINAPLMMRALQFNDQAITDEYTQGQALDTAAASFSRIPDDETRAAQITADYNAKVNQLSKAIAANPANWREYSEPLRRLKQDLTDNYQKGEISKIQSNYNTYKTWKTTTDKMVEQWNKYAGKKGGVDPLTAQVYERSYLDNWRKNGAGTNYKNGQYNTLHMEDVMANMDIKGELAKGFEKVKADLNAVESNEQKGMYIIHRGKETQTVSKAKLMDLAMANISDPTLQSYMRSRQSVGLLKNIYDADGNMINPISGYGVDPAFLERNNKLIADTKKADPKKAEQMQKELDAYTADQAGNIRYNPNSGLSTMLEGAVNSSAWASNKYKEDIKTDQPKLQAWMQGRREAMHEQDIKVRIGLADEAEKNRKAAADIRFEREKELIKLRGENQKAKGTSKAPAAKAAVDKANAISYLQEIPEATHSFTQDYIAGDYEAENRRTLSVGQAMPKVMKELDGTVGGKDNKDFLASYVRYLNGRPATDALATTFLKGQRALDPFFEANLNRSAGTSNPNAQRTPEDILKEVNNIYNKGVNDVYAADNRNQTPSEGHPLTDGSGKALAEALNKSQGFFTLDENGEKVKGIPQLTNVTQVHAGSNQAKIGFKGTTKDGKDVWVFPEEGNEAAYGLSLSSALTGIADPNSVFAMSLKNKAITDLRNEMYQGKPTPSRQVYDHEGKIEVIPKGRTSIIHIGGEEFSAILKEGGGVMLRDPDGTHIKDFESIADVVGWYTQLAKEHEEALKKEQEKKQTKK